MARETIDMPSDAKTEPLSPKMTEPQLQQLFDLVNTLEQDLCVFTKNVIEGHSSL